MNPKNTDKKLLFYSLEGKWCLKRMRMPQSRKDTKKPSLSFVPCGKNS
jgi:hypothetical protein